MTTTRSDTAQELGSTLARIARASKRAVRAALEEHGVTVPQAFVLHSLAEAGGALTVRDLGRSCDMLASTATGVIDRLEAAGLVSRDRDAGDRRVVWVRLSEPGAALEARLPGLGDVMASAFAGLPEADLAAVAGVLRHVLETLDEGGR